MKSNLKFTPWFTKEQKPKRIGVYNASCLKNNQTGRWYAYWDGQIFHQMSSTVEMALFRGKKGNPSLRMRGNEGSWRGLATKTGK